jgi:tetratricopeptide (TPR) repeat protein
MAGDDWTARVAAIWDNSDELGDNIVLQRIDDLVAERPETDAVAAYEAASARDSAGLEAEAAMLYQRALELGLEEPQLGQALIQYASTLRNLGRFDEGLALLDRLDARHPLADSAAAFRSLILASKGETTSALALALETLAPHLPRHARSVTNYARELRG